MKHKKRVLKQITAFACTMAMVVTAIPVSGLSVKAATPAETANVMIDSGGYKTEPIGKGTTDWANTYQERTATLPPSTTYLTDNYRQTVGTVPTSDWASSVVFDKYSESLYAHPLAYRAASNGMQMAYPAVVDSNGSADGEPRVESLLQDDTVELVVGADGFTAKDARVDKTTDWTYEIVMANDAGNASIRSTVAKGTPYAYYTFDNLSPTISLGAGATDLAIYKNSTDSNILGISLKNKKDGKTHYYGVYAPKGTTWKNADGKLTANLPADGKYLSIAILPDNSDKAFELYEKYAFNFITDTKVEWEYHENASKVYTRYNVTTTNMETGATGGDTLIALYPHQWRYLYEKTPTEYTYKTIRGTMKTVEGSNYITEMTYHGILTSLPATTDSKYLGDIKAQLGYLYDYRKNKGDPKWIAPLEWQYGGYDTYWIGKNLNVMSEAIFLADQFNDMKDIKTDMVNGIAGYLQYWFNPGDVYVNDQTGAVDSYFYYHKDYGTMIGYPASYSSDKEMNDHHFHYGYWIKAAAAVAMNNPDWAKQWGGMVYELIGDIANANRDGSSYNENSDTRYPFLRNFDIYEGHSWASGVANYEYSEDGKMNDAGGGLSGGNNQESSSEAVNAWAALILWGEAVGDTRIRDLGVYLYTTEVASVEEYYYDIHDEVFTDNYKDKDNFNIQTVTRLFGGRYDHTAWWTENPIEVTTITMLPLSAATLYMGKDKEKVKAVVDSMSTDSKQWKNFMEKFGNNSSMQANPETNQDIQAMYHAYCDAEAALKEYDYSDAGVVEGGESRAHALAYITSLREYGTQNFEITGSSPLSLVLEKDGKKTYIAENTTDKDQRVYFSDGTYIEVKANSFYEGAKSGDGENPNKDESEILKEEPIVKPAEDKKVNVEVYCEKADGDGYEKETNEVKVEGTETAYTYESEAIPGFTFEEDNADNVLTVEIKEGEVATVKVYYKRNTYGITYNLDGGTLEEDAVKSYKYGSTTILPVPVKEGYEFLGWYDNEEYSGAALKEIPATEMADLALYAKYQAEGSGVNPDNPNPDNPNPDNPDPDNPNPDNPDPDNPNLDNPNPDNPNPDNPNPDNPNPDNPNPDNPNPDNPNPDNPNPDNPNPDNPNPDNPNPDNPNPDNPNPDNPNPDDPNPDNPNQPGNEKEGMDAAPPVITRNPASLTGEYMSGMALTVTASVSDGGILSYQWYQNAANSTTGGMAIAGAIGANYQVPTNTIGTMYYYCVVTNTNVSATGKNTATTVSAVAKVDITKLANPLLKAATSYTKAVGSAQFVLETGAQGVATFQSSDNNVATVEATTGVVTVKKPGTTVITIQALGNDYYNSATLTVTLQVTPKQMKVKMAKALDSKTAVVTWKKVKDITGYEIQYATNKKFKSAKTVKAKKKATSVTLKKLKSGKKYYVRIRAYKMSGNVNLAGGWSKPKTVNVRK